MLEKLFYLPLVVFIFSCGQNSKTKEEEKIPTPEEIKKEISEMDDSLSYYYQQMKENKIQDIHPNVFLTTIEKNLSLYRLYPKSAEAPKCLDKVQQLYTQQKQYYLALNFSDTLLSKYPKYKGNALVLLNAGSIADGILNDKKLVEKYYRQLIKDYPSLDKETKEMVEFRLKHIDLTFDQMIDLQMKNISKK
jgi:tetratricopeptide (TPR) repeat protein